MNLALIGKALGLLFMLLALMLLAPTGVAVWYREEAVSAFFSSSMFTLFLGILLLFLNRDAAGTLRSRGAFLLVGLSWVGATVIGAFPLFFSGAFPSMIDAWFESTSGFTTTGATVIADVESLPRSILLWRSLSQYLGGMGIIVLSLAVLPLLGVGGMDLYRAESPGPTSDKLTTRVSETARRLWLVYVALMLSEMLILWLLGMSLFDALNHALTTMATGGFSTKTASVAAFDSALIDSVITFFMFLAGVNFLLHYRLFVRFDFSVFKAKELHFYLVLLLSSTLLLTLHLWEDYYGSVGEAFRYAVFQVVSVCTTTGYGTADFNLWGGFAHVVLLLLMIVGGCSGSTAGGIKCVRAMLLVKQGYRELYMMIHPKAVYPLKLDGKAVPSGVASAIFGFFFLYILLLAGTTLFVTASGVDLLSAVSGTLSALSNVGPGLEAVGPASHYGSLPDLAKVLLSWCMIIGRLELFTILVVLTPEFWQS